jgi:arabinose-5-phosphate isomerase
VIAMTGQPGSTLARHADIVLDCSVAKEACPLNLAPTASSIAQLAMGDALAWPARCARIQGRGLCPLASGRGAGAQAADLVRDVMRTGDAVPRIGSNASLSDMMREMSAKGLGAVAIVDAQQHIEGIFTDGDLRRLVEKGQDLRALTPAR